MQISTHHHIPLLGAFLVLILSIESSFAAPVMLDFSSGVYSTRPPLAYTNVYEEDDFSVRTTSIFREFHDTGGVYGPTLDWYESDIVIIVDSTQGAFDVLSVDLVVQTFAGLTFESSAGGLLNGGGRSGTTINFSGPQWTGIDFFTIKTTLDFDILTRLDNLALNTRPVPEPAPLLLLAAAPVALITFRTKRRRP